MVKTPVMLLNELSMQMGLVPLYELIDSKSGPNTNTFTFRINLKGICANGCGPNKKDAKHNAAQKMLQLLVKSDLLPEKTLSLLPEKLQPITSTQSTNVKASMSTLPVADSPDLNSDDSFINYVGQLNEFCMAHNLPDPVYNCERQGPAHISMFIMNCYVSSEHEKASGNSKKTAKHKVAKKMLDKLSKSNEPKYKVKSLDELGVEFMNLNLEPVPMKINTNSIIERYKKQTKKYICKKDIPIGEYHLALTNIFIKLPFDKRAKIEMIPKLDECLEIGTLKNTFFTIFDEPMEIINFPGLNDQQYVIGFRFAFQPPLLQIGIGKTKAEAEKQALNKLMETIALFMIN